MFFEPYHGLYMIRKLFILKEMERDEKMEENGQGTVDRVTGNRKP